MLLHGFPIRRVIGSVSAVGVHEPRIQMVYDVSGAFGRGFLTKGILNVLISKKTFWMPDAMSRGGFGARLSVEVVFGVETDEKLVEDLGIAPRSHLDVLLR